MPAVDYANHYAGLQAQIAADIKASQAYTASQPIRFGMPIKPITGVSHAVVNTSVSRENVGRHVNEQWTFNIALRVLKSEIPANNDSETYLMQVAFNLVYYLAPFNLLALPAPATEYAGVGNRRRVTSIEPTDGSESDADTFFTVVVEFVVFTVAYQ